MATLFYRNAHIEDLDRIVEIYNSTVHSRMVTADTEPVSIESRMAWFLEHNPKTRPLWVVEDENNDMVGWVSFQSFYGRPAYSNTAEISIYLDPAFRSKGMGKKILHHVFNQVRSLGINTLLGFIFAHNEPSVKLFRQMGFEDWATLPNIANIDGVERSVKILGKRIW